MPENNFTFHSGWKIIYESIEPTGWIFYIQPDIPMIIGNKIEYLKSEVGFFTELKDGCEVSRLLIDLCLEMQRRAVTDTVAHYRKDRHDRTRKIREILWREVRLINDTGDIQNRGN